MRVQVLLSFALFFLSSHCSEKGDPSSSAVIWNIDSLEGKLFFTSQDVEAFHKVLVDSRLPRVLEHSGFIARLLSTYNSLLATVLGSMFKTLCDSQNLLGFFALFFAVSVLETIFGMLHTGSTYQVHQRYKTFIDDRKLIASENCCSKPGTFGMDALRTLVSVMISIATAITLATKDQSMCGDGSANLFHDKVYLGFLLVPCLLQTVLRIFDPQSVGKIEREYRLTYLTDK